MCCQRMDHVVMSSSCLQAENCLQEHGWSDRAADGTYLPLWLQLCNWAHSPESEVQPSLQLLDSKAQCHTGWKQSAILRQLAGDNIVRHTMQVCRTIGLPGVLNHANDNKSLGLLSSQLSIGLSFVISCSLSCFCRPCHQV